MNKEEFLSHLKDSDKFKEQLQKVAIDHLHEFTDLLYDSTRHTDPFGDTLVTFDMLDYAINIYIDILEKSARAALEHVRQDRKFQMENK